MRRAPSPQDGPSPTVTSDSVGEGPSSGSPKHCWDRECGPHCPREVRVEEAPVRHGVSRRKGTHVVPLGLEFLLLKASVLPEVSQVGQGLPDDQEEDTDQHDAYHGAPYDGSHVGAFHAL